MSGSRRYSFDRTVTSGMRCSGTNGRTRILCKCLRVSRSNFLERIIVI